MSRRRRRHACSLEIRLYVYLFFILFVIFISDLVAELPFILMHPKPEEEESNIIHLERSPGKHSTNERSGNDDGNENASGHITTGNLIQLDG